MQGGAFSGFSIDSIILFIILLILIFVLFVMYISLHSKYNKLNISYQMFMKGREAQSMEEEIMALFDEIDNLNVVSEKNSKDINRMIDNLRECYQRVGIVKYDAFKEMGGKLSFSVALLNDNATGFILNSVHSSDGCYVYTKEIVEGECTISLGDEEKKALTLALQDEPFNYQ